MDEDKKRQTAERMRRYRERKKALGDSPHKVWTCVFYEESAEPWWRDAVSEAGLEVCVSPLHDRDAWTARDEAKDPVHRAGELKKPHRHLLVSYEVGQTYAQVVADFGFLNTTNWKYVKSKSAMALYLTHEREKGKARYDSAEVLEFGGASWRDWCMDSQDVAEVLPLMRAEIVRQVREEGPWRAELALFWQWCDEHNADWAYLLDTCCSATVERFMKSVRGVLEHGDVRAREMLLDGRLGACRVMSDETGEVVAEFADAADAAGYCDYLATLGTSAHIVGEPPARREACP